MAKDSILTDFQAFLRSRKLVPEKNIPYFAHWASRFLYFCNKNNELDNNKLVMEFMDSLQKDHKIPEWQIRQARQAVQVYLVNFKGKTASDALYFPAGRVAKGSDVSRIIEEMKRSIRLKHYSLSTERSYLDCAKRFFGYVYETKGDETAFAAEEPAGRTLLRTMTTENCLPRFLHNVRSTVRHAVNTPLLPSVL
jgi:hypothetical protein